MSTSLPLDQLHPHPLNSNRMPADLYRKLLAHLRDADRYPPLIVRPLPTGGHQLLDGHHRAQALRELGRSHARCEVWDVSDADALLLLATLNRLQGRDDPDRRANLMAELAAVPGLDPRWLQRLPEDRRALDQLARLRTPPPAPLPPVPLQQLPVAVHFFLLPAQKLALDRRLAEVPASRELALLTLLGLAPEPRV